MTGNVAEQLRNVACQIERSGVDQERIMSVDLFSNQARVHVASEEMLDKFGPSFQVTKHRENEYIRASEIVGDVEFFCLVVPHDERFAP